MALLTAEDILNKAFETVKFREGYDIDQVDDFLDEVVKTVSALQADNDALRGKLSAAEQRVAELTRAQAQATPQATPVVAAPVANDGEVQELRAQLAQANQQMAAANQQISQLSAFKTTADQQINQLTAANTALQTQLAQAPQAGPGIGQPVNVPIPPAPEPPAATPAPTEAHGMLVLAQKLHDDYVSSGQEEGERIVAAAKKEAAQIVNDANEQSERTLTQLEQEKQLLERKIEELRLFERDYRTRLKSYLQNLLTDLDQRGNSVPARPDPTAKTAPVQI